MPEGTNRLGPIRINNTIRCVVPGNRKDEVNVDYFVERILFDLLKLDARKVLFFQHHVAFAAFEVTVVSGELFRGAKKMIAENMDLDLLRGLEFTSSDGFASVVVQVFTPHITTEDVALFLSRYCLEVRDGSRLTSRHGLFMGRRRFRVRFKTKPDGTTLYPPHMFFLGSEKGYLFIEGQPGACWRCGAVGHRMADCSMRSCRFCGSAEHLSDACTVPRACSTCGSENHLFRNCPRRSRNAAQGTMDNGRHSDSASSPHGPEEPPSPHPVAAVEGDSEVPREALVEEDVQERPPVDSEAVEPVASELPLGAGSGSATQSASVEVGEGPEALLEKSEEESPLSPGLLEVIGRSTQDSFADVMSEVASDSPVEVEEDDMPSEGEATKRGFSSDEEVPSLQKKGRPAERRMQQESMDAQVVRCIVGGVSSEDEKEALSWSLSPSGAAVELQSSGEESAEVCGVGEESEGAPPEVEPGPARASFAEVVSGSRSPDSLSGDSSVAAAGPGATRAAERRLSRLPVRVSPLTPGRLGRGRRKDSGKDKV